MHLSQECIEKILAHFGVALVSVDEEKDTSRGEEDLRYHYFINGRYVLHCACGAPMEEGRLREIAVLIAHYREIGVYCPGMIKSSAGDFSVQITENGKEFSCYLDEKAPYETAEKALTDRVRQECLQSLGRLAAKYTGKELANVRSMWSLIDLAPPDKDVDEKQENLNWLAESLRKAGALSLAGRLLRCNDALRERIRKDYQKLPRCVYQGDLNETNLLVKDGHFAGILDFNMSGTEVNINCFLNETAHFPEEEEMLCQSAAVLYANATAAQQRDMAEILAHYSLNDLERELLPYYQAIVFISQWPHICIMRKMLKDEKGRAAVEGLLEYVLGIYEGWFDRKYELETKRLYLRPFRKEDAPLILRISSDPDTIKYLYRWGLPGSTPESDVHTFLGYALREWAKEPVRAREYCIVLKETGETLGDGSVEYWGGDEVAEIGWILTPEHRGKGYVTEMGRELMRFAFEEMNVNKVIAHCDARNAPSYRVMERLGMALESLEKEARPAKIEGGKKGDEMTYAITRDAWEKARENACTR